MWNYKYEEPDKIEIQNIGPYGLIMPSELLDTDEQSALEIQSINSHVKVKIEGYSKEEIKGWVEIASGSYRKTEEGKKLSIDYWLKMKEDNPIQIIK